MLPLKEPQQDEKERNTEIQQEDPPRRQMAKEVLIPNEAPLPESRAWCIKYPSEAFPRVDVFPLNDLEPHYLDDCACCPRLDFVDGMPRLIHEAFDGREIIEELEAIGEETA